MPNSLPRWFARPHAIDCLIYLDELNDETGTLSVVPGSHHWRDKSPPPLAYELIPGKHTLELQHGSMVIIHGNLWHRALPTRNGRRRLLILVFTPCWLRASPRGGPPTENGLTRELLATDNPEIREILRLSGYTQRKIDAASQADVVTQSARKKLGIRLNYIKTSMVMSMVVLKLPLNIVNSRVTELWLTQGIFEVRRSKRLSSKRSV